MNRAYPVSVEDLAAACPVPLDTLGQIYRADPEFLLELVEGIPEAARARLAVYLYGRSHTHEIGVRIASTCEGSTLRRAAGLVGHTLHDLSRRPGTAPNPGRGMATTARKVSLGSCSTEARVAG